MGPRGTSPLGPATSDAPFGALASVMSARRLSAKLGYSGEYPTARSIALFGGLKRPLELPGKFVARFSSIAETPGGILRFAMSYPPSAIVQSAGRR